MNPLVIVFRLVTGLTELIVHELRANQEEAAAANVEVAMGFGLKVFERLTNGEPLDELLNKRARDLMTEEDESEVAADEAVKRAKNMFGRK
jgi:hypothetical protein